MRYSPSIATRICRELAKGRSLTEICLDKGMPCQTTVFGWLMPGTRSHRPEFLSQYRVARMWQSEAIVERLLEVASDEALDKDRKKAMMDALKVAAARLEPKKYGIEPAGETVIRVVYEE